MSWQPDPGSVAGILQLLRDSQVGDPQTQRSVQQQLASYNAIPDFSNYLAYIYAELRSEPEYVRTAAGIMLKNNLRDYYGQLPDEVRRFIKAEVLKCMSDPVVSVRKAFALIVTMLIDKDKHQSATAGGLGAWPHLLGAIGQALEAGSDAAMVDGAFGALQLLCEDHADQLDAPVDPTGARPLNTLLPHVLNFFRSSHEPFRRAALSCVSLLLVDMPAAVMVNMDNIMQGLLFLRGDPSAAVQRKVCSALATLCEAHADYLEPHLAPICEFVLAATELPPGASSGADDSNGLALEACEFWQALAESELCYEMLPPYLPRLYRALLDRMVYSADELAQLADQCDESAADAQQQMRPDRDQDVKPHWRRRPGDESVVASDADADDDDEEGGGDDDDEASEWTLRKCAAVALDVLATVFTDETLPLLLPLVQQRLEQPSSQWLVREAALLALGAVADGCGEGMSEHLPQLAPFLLAQLRDSQPLVRAITCWTVSRYVRPLLALDSARWLPQLVGALLERLGDRTKKVQETACSAFAYLEEAAARSLVPYLGPIVQTLMQCYERYSQRNRLLLYDVLATLADVVGAELNRAELLLPLLPPLMNRWSQLPDDDDSALCPLLECLTSLTAAVGVGFQSYAQPVFVRCCHLADTAFRRHAARQAASGVAPQPSHQTASAVGGGSELELAVCALNLISGMCEGLQASIESLVAAHPPLLELLYTSLQSGSAPVRQAGFALVGDLAKFSFVHLKPTLPQYMPVLLNNLQLEFVSVCNNASWSLGEIAVRLGPELQPWIAPALHKLVSMLATGAERAKERQRRVPSFEHLLDNVAITLGRVGNTCPDQVAAHLEHFVQPWCMRLRQLHDDTEKESAFRGLCALIQRNPQAVVQHFVWVCDAIASWRQAPASLQPTFSNLLHGFKNSIPAQQWSEYFKTFPLPLQQILRDVYKL
eukprot:TRINITY_DN1998_c0_g1_i1.p1 TRINITY_DN1998_c0_g1~~TRINITY_DN1998_c0_g1_i1.p1  ORF type:complete len:943 (+),score=353.81 TRINITY_DN1998_c0_g1_i1:161-2989(+)